MYFAFREWQPSTFCIRIGLLLPLLPLFKCLINIPQISCFISTYILLPLQTEGICHSPLGIYSNYFLWTSATTRMLAAHVPQLTEINSCLGNQKLIVHQAKGKRWQINDATTINRRDARRKGESQTNPKTIREKKAQKHYKFSKKALLPIDIPRPTTF